MKNTPAYFPQCEGKEKSLKGTMTGPPTTTTTTELTTTQYVPAGIYKYRHTLLKSFTL